MSTDRLLLELKAVSKKFGDTTVLQRIDLAVADGEFITILGPSGSGKTTILRMIGGFESPSSGEILLDGADISRRSHQQAALQHGLSGLRAFRI